MRLDLFSRGLFVFVCFSLSIHTILNELFIYTFLFLFIGIFYGLNVYKWINKRLQDIIVTSVPLSIAIYTLTLEEYFVGFIFLLLYFYSALYSYFSLGEDKEDLTALDGFHDSLKKYAFGISILLIYAVVSLILTDFFLRFISEDSIEKAKYFFFTEIFLLHIFVSYTTYSSLKNSKIKEANPFVSLFVRIFDRKGVIIFSFIMLPIIYFLLYISPGRFTLFISIIFTIDAINDYIVSKRGIGKGVESDEI